MKYRSISYLLLIGCVMIFLWKYRAETHAQPSGLPCAMKRYHMPPQKPLNPNPGNRKVTGVKIKKGDTLASLLAREGVLPGEAHAIGLALKDVLSPRKIKVGALFSLFREENGETLTELKITNSVDQAVRVFRLEDGNWGVQELDLHLFTSLVRGKGSIDDSFWNAARATNIPPEIILDTADLFGWQVDFTSGLRQKDCFDVFYTNRTLKELGVVPGRINAARFVNEGKEYCAFAFTHPDGSTEYYDADGNSMKRAFLKTPLQYRYISSGFSHSRYHPILKIHRPHLGIDYAAPKGTPVSALGDGVVVFCGWKGGYGNFVQIKHGDSYETCYGHLDRFGKGIRKGTPVRQGQIIGYVGSTGLSTGPHLDFRVKYRGMFINPAKIKSEPAEPVPETQRDMYAQHVRNWMERFEIADEGEAYVTGEFFKVR